MRSNLDNNRTWALSVVCIFDTKKVPEMRNISLASIEAVWPQLGQNSIVPHKTLLHAKFPRIWTLLPPFVRPIYSNFSLCWKANLHYFILETVIYWHYWTTIYFDSRQIRYLLRINWLMWKSDCISHNVLIKCHHNCQELFHDLTGFDTTSCNFDIWHAQQCLQLGKWLYNKL